MQLRQQIEEHNISIGVLPNVRIRKLIAMMTKLIDACSEWSVQMRMFYRSENPLIHRAAVEYHMPHAGKKTTLVIFLIRIYRLYSFSESGYTYVES